MNKIKIIAAGILNYFWNDLVTHIPVHFIRKGFLRLFNRKISRSAVILLHTRILNFWSVVIGDRSVINQYVLLDCRKYPVIIRHDVDIGPYSKIWTLGHDPDSPTHEVEGGQVVIEDHCWIASNVTILPRVTLGRGCVVAAASVVSKNIPPLTLWGGMPARFIRSRTNALTYKLNYTPYFD
jgi:putative colanic acid biosynthesis acetyltransferase WcaF